MSILTTLKNLFKSKDKKEKINFKTCNINELSKFIENIDDSDSQDINFLDNMWGHACNVDDEPYNTDGTFIIYQCHGFHSGGHLIGTRRMRVGDFIILNTDKGKSSFLILEIESQRDPDDMFFAKITGIGRD